MAEATRVRFGEARDTYPGKPFAKHQDKNTRKGHLTGDRPSETDSGKFQELVPRYNKEASTDLLHLLELRHDTSAGAQWQWSLVGSARFELPPSLGGALTSLAVVPLSAAVPPGQGNWSLRAFGSTRTDSSQRAKSL